MALQQITAHSVLLRHSRCSGSVGSMCYVTRAGDPDHSWQVLLEPTFKNRMAHSVQLLIPTRNYTEVRATTTTPCFDLKSLAAAGEHGANRLRRFAPHARRHRLRAARRDAHD